MRTLRSALFPWLAISSAVLLFGIFAFLRVPSTDATTVGQLTGFGAKLDNSKCYLSVSYTVDGVKSHLETPQEKKWCGYAPLLKRRTKTPLVVHYDSAKPTEATLTPRGRLPSAAIVGGLAGVLLAGTQMALRRRRRSDQDHAFRGDLSEEATSARG